nr:helix-turn-helix domain-containing protein [Solidesulfovibrio aerotolerans]
MKRIGTREAAKRLGVCAGTVRRYIQDGKLNASKLPGGHYRIRPEDVDALMDEDFKVLMLARKHGII